MLLETSKSFQTSTCFSFYLLVSPPPLLYVVIVGAFLQSPGLPLLGGGVVAVVVQQEGPHLTTDRWVNTTEEDSLMRSGMWTNTVSTKGVFSDAGHTVRDHFQQMLNSENISYYMQITHAQSFVKNKACTQLSHYQKLLQMLQNRNTNTVLAACPAKKKKEKNSAVLFLHFCVYWGNVLVTV